MSNSKQGGSSRLGRDSAAQRLGIKINAGQIAKIGMIIIRQRGTKYLLGKNVKKGSDDTIYAMKDGVVKITTKSKKLFNGKQRLAKVVSVEIAKAK
jgi:large subunit ribosomal protein L27